MDLNNVFVADIETRGFLDVLNSFEDFHVLGVGYKNKGGKWEVRTFRNREHVQKLFGNKDNIIVMHNGRRFDKPALEKMGIEVNAMILDSLPLAWNLFPNRSKMGKKFGLEAFGEDYGFPKPKVDDEAWKGLSQYKLDILKKDPLLLKGGELDEYKTFLKEKQDFDALMDTRVIGDVKINIMLWEDLLIKLNKIYEGDELNRNRLINLLNFIMDCAYHQEVQGVHVDIKKTEENLSYFETLKAEKIQKLIEAMPKKPLKVNKMRPKVTHKKDGSLSKAGEEWKKLTDSLNLSFDYPGPIELIKGYEDANPNSVQQKKDWLYSLNWVPETYKYNRNKETGEEKKVEQIMTDEKMLCPSILKLAKKYPIIQELDGLTVLTHRIGILKSFLEKCDENGMIIQGLQQLALTMRWQHSVIVNIPKYTGKGDLRDGKWIRECLIAPPGKKIIQADLSGIESRTSDHYTFHINPERIVKTQMPYFDPHCEIALFAGLMTEAEEVFYIFKGAQKDNPELDIHTFSEIYKWSPEVQKLLDLPESEQKELLQKLKNVRSKGKTTNYASLYQVGAATLSRNLEISKNEAQKLINSYWDIHYAVKEFTESVVTKDVDGETWAFNPIARFWYYIRQEKDIFSCINQSSAVFCFNMWLYFIVKRGHWPVNQTHDDCVLLSDNNEEDISRTRQVFHDAMDDVNNYLKLNVKLDCESQVGSNLSETH